jgi:hypothetical protein
MTEFPEAVRALLDGPNYAHIASTPRHTNSADAPSALAS